MSHENRPISTTQSSNDAANDSNVPTAAAAAEEHQLTAAVQQLAISQPVNNQGTENAVFSQAQQRAGSIQIGPVYEITLIGDPNAMNPFLERVRLDMGARFLTENINADTMRLEFMTNRDCLVTFVVQIRRRRDEIAAGTHAGIIVYDMTSRQSLEDYVESSYNDMVHIGGGEFPIVVCACNADSPDRRYGFTLPCNLSQHLIGANRAWRPFLELARDLEARAGQAPSSLLMFPEHQQWTEHLLTRALETRTTQHWSSIVLNISYLRNTPGLFSDEHQRHHAQAQGNQSPPHPAAAVIKCPFCNHEHHWAPPGPTKLGLSQQRSHGARALYDVKGAKCPICMEEDFDALVAFPCPHWVCDGCFHKLGGKSGAESR